MPELAPNDPSGVLGTLGPRYRSSYVGFTDVPLAKSAWSNWKPPQSSGWNVQIVWQPLLNDFTVKALAALEQELKSSGKVSTIGVQYPSSPTDVPQQLQQIQTAIERKPTLLIVFPLAPSPVVPLINKAGQEGIPTVAPWTPVASKYAETVYLNSYLNWGLTSAGALKLMGGKGSVLEVEGIPGISVSIDTAAAWKAALSRCPNVKVAGEVVGNFQNSLAKGAAQQFLATHPSGVQGVLEGGAMGIGVLQAFTQTGHSPPPTADPGSPQGAIAYWHAHPDYQEVGSALADTQYGHGFGDVALRLLEGQGPKINVILDKPYLITKANLSSVWLPSFAEGSQADAQGPANQYLTDGYLNGFFQHPAQP